MSDNLLEIRKALAESKDLMMKMYDEYHKVGRDSGRISPRYLAVGISSLSLVIGHAYKQLDDLWLANFFARDQIALLKNAILAIPSVRDDPAVMKQISDLFQNYVDKYQSEPPKSTGS